MSRSLIFIVCMLFGARPVFAYPKSDFEGRQISESAESLLLARKFDELEKLADGYRKSNRKIRGGNSPLYHFYPGLSYFGKSDIFTSSASSEQKRVLLEEWHARDPASITAKIGLALYWENSGWIVRGGAFAKDVSPQQWKTFREDLVIAKQYLSAVDSKADPYVYLLLAGIAKGTSPSREDMDKLYNSSIKAFPDFFHYYADRAVSLLDRWYGEPGEIADLAASVLKTPGGENGAIAYTYITMQLLVHDENKIFHELGLKWEPIKAGYEAREKKFGLRIRDWNALCYLAALSGHSVEAKAALQHIDNEWDAGLWGTKENFDAATNWINSSIPDPKSKSIK